MDISRSRLRTHSHVERRRGSQSSLGVCCGADSVGGLPCAEPAFLLVFDSGSRSFINFYPNPSKNAEIQVFGR